MDFIELNWNGVMDIYCVMRKYWPWILDICIWSENFEKVSSKWDQLLLFNKMIVTCIFSILID
jgi:hypothetical protein